MAGHEYGVSTRTLTVLVYIVSIVWAVNILAPLVAEGYASNTQINAVMGALMGLLGAFRYRASRDGRAPEESNPHD